MKDYTLNNFPSSHLATAILISRYSGETGNIFKIGYPTGSISLHVNQSKIVLLYNHHMETPNLQIVESLVDPIRNASRQLVRELGFSNSALAATNFSPSAVHSIVEIGEGNVSTATQLCSALNLEKSSVSRMLRSLIEAGEVYETQSSVDSREKLLALTSKGLVSLTTINQIAQKQVLNTLNQLPSRHNAETVLSGLQQYVAALRATRLGEKIDKNKAISISKGYVPGLVGRTIQMHMKYYSEAVGFGAYFESRLAANLADLTGRLQNDKNEVWSAILDGEIVGTVFIDGEDLGQNRAHLKAYIVDESVRGTGVGRKLLVEAVSFADTQGFDETRLWTFRGLDAALRLYQMAGFELITQAAGSQWGKEVIEQVFIRKWGANNGLLSLP